MVNSSMFYLGLVPEFRQKLPVAFYAGPILSNVLNGKRKMTYEFGRTAIIKGRGEMGKPGFSKSSKTKSTVMKRMAIIVYVHWGQEKKNVLKL